LKETVSYLLITPFWLVPSLPSFGNLASQGDRLFRCSQISSQFYRISTALLSVLGSPAGLILVANSKSWEHHLKNSIIAIKLGNDHIQSAKKAIQVGKHAPLNRVRQQ
jgi:hypothetical protein